MLKFCYNHILFRMTTCFRDALNRIGVPSEKSEIYQEESKSESNHESEIKKPLPQPEHVVLHLRNIKGSLKELDCFVEAIQREQHI